MASRKSLCMLKMPGSVVRVSRLVAPVYGVTGLACARPTRPAPRRGLKEEKRILTKDRECVKEWLC
jgi:hypothetical protein